LQEAAGHTISSHIQADKESILFIAKGFYYERKTNVFFGILQLYHSCLSCRSVYFFSKNRKSKLLSYNQAFDEKGLFLRIAEGDEEAFRTLYHQYGRMLLPFLLKLTHSPDMADEIIQEVFLRIWLNRDKLQAVTYPRAYIYKMASNQVHNWINKNLLSQKAIHRHITQFPEAENPVEKNLEVQEMLAVLRQAVEELPAQRRLIYVMNREKGMKAAEIADALQLSVHTVKNTLAAALKQIRERLAQKGYLLSFLLLLLKK
jgi:RNA polymerase sigma-70 factor (ECF subfamily)